ncbi:efflux RND transporter periplasmic adaptor subunit [Sphaerochaeta sp. PS]|uniref:efflux RND transporter periplasmic adaptor subunit n=1 Tax=Sphaerochaeta sp. PS TaxID=3076336 RepID=UPI0028A4D65C|nr:efflux RND transporter periplasmic adaptor subunit [Sphaerochaeta sp. PS]MDT4761730.1 efflux RND transporter periplasmic adaptor subunit [Sphaerochaeta sp. PS]
MKQTGKTLGLLVVLLSSMVLFSCTKKTAEPLVLDGVAAATDYTQVVSSAVEVKIAPLRDRVIGSGTIQGREEVSVKARSAGVIKSINFNLGAKLEKDQVILVLDDTIPLLNVSQLENQYTNSLKELKANEQLYERGAIALVQLTQTQSSVDGLAAQLQQARNNLKNMMISTPIAGRVAEKTSLVVGDLIQAGQQVVRVVDLDQLRLTLPVGQNQLFLIKEGARAIITLRTPTEIIEAEGIVSAISAGSDLRTGSWSVLVDFTNPRPNLIKAGLSAQVTIFNDDAPTYTLVPNSALVFREGTTSVYMVEGTTARKVLVKVVDQYGDQSAVESLEDDVLLTGKSVLVSALSRILDGSSVVTQETL